MQFLYCGKKATLSIGNVKPIGEMPEGTIICNVEEVLLVANYLPSILTLSASHYSRMMICHPIHVLQWQVIANKSLPQGLLLSSSFAEWMR